ncbi:NAD(P)-dependent dehydrogenase (short-subunit alcohol dehydrogenase family) [Saonia flava]|uniref:NAD(P)-dependent dehydrogenase (Short-subunit alcohol dehydrogenase family) n=1 Tax=Saonia flava TaxID=523696 RepID=A0A846QNC2_9FLAO|nr:SDR family oxidoreductase [Saonia flava]NJB69591.1 NAD(P)-dependent dehydrogenase (short-subunit alcohol dehydrogenase family) [Saonia flava]
MKGKVVLITGGSSGIGRAIGVFLKSKEFTVYGTTRNLKNHKNFNEFELLQLNVSNTESIQSAVNHIIEKEGRIDILINNAGVGITGAVEETPHEEILKVFDTNFHGPLHMIKAVLPHMRSQKEGLVINITSIAGYMGLPFRGFYSATKGALGLITEALRMETKDFGIKITNLAPGDFATNIAAGRYHVPLLDDSPYRENYGTTLSTMNEHVDNGSDPIDVAKEVYKIIGTTKPKVHYKVGEFMQKFSIVLKMVLPDKVYEKLLLNHYKL